MKQTKLILILMIFSSCLPENEQEKDFFLDINGNQIHVKVEGAGEPIIFAHGGYLNLEMWQPQIEAFKSTNRVIRFSDLGHGETKQNGNPIFGYEIIEELMNYDSQERVTLVGLSWGAMICVDFALKYPEKVDKLILVSPGLNGWEYFQDSIASANYALRKIASEEQDIPKAAALFHQNWVIGPRRKSTDIASRFYKESLEMIESTMTNHWQEDWSNLDSVPAISRLEQLEIPTFLIIGDQDGEDIKLIAQQYAAKVPNLKKTVLKDVAHLLNMEQPADFNRILREIIEE